MPESLGQKTIRGTVWSAIDSLANQGIAFAVGLVLARLLSPDQFGLIGIILIFIAISNSLVDSGFSNALIRKTDISDCDYNTVFLTNLGMSIVITVLMFCFAPAISRFFDQPSLTPLTRAMASVVIINALAIVPRTIMSRDIDFRSQARISLAASVIAGVIGIGMALAGYGVWSLVAMHLSRQTLTAVLFWLWSPWRPRLEFSTASFMGMYGFGWRLMVSALIDTLWRQLYQFVIGKCYSPSALGQYTRAQQFGSIFSSNLTYVVQRVSYPVLSSISADRQRLCIAYRRIIRLTMLVTFVCMLSLAAMAKPLVLVLVGDKWLPCVPMLRLLCLSMMLYPLHAINLNMLQVTGRSDLFLRLEIIKKCVAVVPVLIGIFVSILWMLGAGVFSGMIAYYLNASYSGRLIGYSFARQIRDILPSLAVAALVAVAMYTVSLIALPMGLLLTLQLAVGALALFVILEATNLPEYRELKSLAAKLLTRSL